MNYVYKNWKLGLLGTLFVYTTVVSATGMAVGIDKLYIQNTSKQTVKIHMDNLDKNAQNLSILANSICKIDKKIIFIPNEMENNSFVIMLQNPSMINPIVMDKEGNLALANFARLKFNFNGDVKYYNLLGYCANKIQQSKLLSVIVTSDLYNLPLFNLKNCSSNSSFVYVINQNKQFKAQNSIDFSKVKPCTIDP